MQWDLTVAKDRKGKSDAMASPVSGVLVCMRYWCKGNIGKLFQIVITLITCFSLEDPVLNVLQKPAAKKQRTNDYVVYRLHCALVSTPRHYSAVLNTPRHYSPLLSSTQHCCHTGSDSMKIDL
jgi:hypothetical protein